MQPLHVILAINCSSITFKIVDYIPSELSPLTPDMLVTL